jgi:chaperonin cofactor prefoldin
VLDFRASIPALQERLDMVETVNGIGPDDEGNLSFVSGTVQIGSGTEDHTVSLEVPEYDPIESINEVGPSADGKFFLKSDTVKIFDPEDPQSPNTLRLEVDTGGVERINTVEPGANGEIQLRSNTLNITPDTNANAIDIEAVDTSGGLQDELDELEERVTILEDQPGSGSEELEKRVRSLETSRIKHSVHCTGMSYRILAERYPENDSLLAPIKNIITAVESVVSSGDYTATAYVGFIETVKTEQQTVNDELNADIATPPSIDRYETALKELNGIPTDAGSVGDLTVAQECLSKAAEWIQRPRS